MLNCQRATQLMSEALDRRLSWSERLGLRLHLMICDACTHFRAQMDVLRTACARFREGGGGDREP